MVVISVRVTTSTGSPVSGASVTVTVAAPNGGVASGTGTTGSNGVVNFDYYLGFSPPAGTYSVSATASAAGYNSGSGSTTFNVT